MFFLKWCLSSWRRFKWLFWWKTDLTSKVTPIKLLHGVNKLFTLASNMRNIIHNMLGHSWKTENELKYRHSLSSHMCCWFYPNRLPSHSLPFFLLWYFHNRNYSNYAQSRLPEMSTNSIECWEEFWEHLSVPNNCFKVWRKKSGRKWTTFKNVNECSDK